MAFVLGVGTDITDEFVATQSLTSYLIGEDEILRGESAPAFTFEVGSDGSNLLVAGRIESTYDTALWAVPGTNGVSVRIGSTGEVLGTGDVVVFSGNAARLTNFGRIETTGSNQVAVRFENESAQLVNNGLVAALAAYSDAVNLSGAPLENTEHVVFNTGTIAGATGIQVHDLFFAEIENWGLIWGADGREAIALGTGSEAVRLHNVGVIDGGAYGILNQDAAGVLFTNAAGAVLRSRGDPSTLITPASADPIAYQGGSGSDDVLNGGTIEGAVRLGAGDDGYVGYGTGDVDGAVYGDDGNDTLLGSRSGDRLYGGADDDTIEGNVGRDRLFGGTGGDLLIGGTRNDTLKGGAGDDVLKGGSGDDVIEGGTGLDTLKGGLDPDVFVFETGWEADTIVDFDAGGSVHDWIDLSALDTVTDWADLVANHMTQLGADVVIDGLDGDTLTLLGVALPDLDAGDFLF